MSQVHRSETISKITAALSAVQGALEHAGRSSKNPHLKSTYADLTALIDVAKEPLLKNGLAVVQVTAIGDDGRVYLITELVHSSGEFFRSHYPLRPLREDPQGFGSAMTYARRYCYQAIIGIASIGEDDDGHKASEPSPHPVVTAQAKKPLESSREKKPTIPENPWLWTLQAESQFKGKTIAELEDDTITLLKADVTRAALLKQGKLTKWDNEALIECFKNEDARLEAVSSAMLKSEEK